MIGKTLQNLLEQKNINVNELSKMINVSNQTLYSIIKRDNMKIDFEVLIKICKALNVSIEYFYSDYKDSINNQIVLSNHEIDLINAYRNHPEMQDAVDKLLNVQEDTIKLKAVARSTDNQSVVDLELTKKQLEAIENAPPFDEDI